MIENVESGGRRREGLRVISDKLHHTSVHGKPASSRDGEEKYSGCVSKYRFLRFLTVMRASELREREGRLEKSIGDGGVFCCS